ncbi:MAG: branched-chain amino acid ABC transporter substrate-binding protein [Gaiellales bacterium]
MRGLLVTLAILALAAVLVSCGDSHPAAMDDVCAPADNDCVEVGIGEPIYLGAFLALDFASGRDVLASVRLALDYLDGAFDQHQGQLLGHDVALLVEKDGCSPLSGRIGAEALLTEPGLLAVIGPTCSGTASGSADRVFSDHDVLLVSPSNTAPSLTDPDAHQRTYFRTAFNDAIQGSVVADFVFSRQERQSAVTIAKAEDAYSSQLAGTFSNSFAALGGTVARSFSLKPKDSRTGVALALAADPPEAIFISLQTPDCGQVAAAVRSQRALDRSLIVVAESCQTEDFVASLGAKARGIYASGPDFSAVQDDRFYRDWFLPAYRQLTGNPPDGVFGPSAFDATGLVVDAIRRTAQVLPGGVLRFSRAQLRRALLDVSRYAGLSGSLTCLPTGDCSEGARIAIYRAPDWPIVRGDRATPVFSQFKTLAEVGLIN